MLTIRNQTPLLYHPDHDIVFENVFHPFDPLAYRFEPLINEYYTEQPAVLVERSVPLGPSFSFPSLPSLPGAGLLSFFSWKASASQQQQQQQQQQRRQQQPSNNEEPKTAQQTTLQATNMAAKAGKHHHRDDTRSPESIVAKARGEQPQQKDDDAQQQESKKFVSSFNAFLQYFSSPSSSTQRKKQKRKSNQGNADERRKERQMQKNDNTATATTTTTTLDSVPGIITWDPLQDDVKDQMLALKSNDSELRNDDDSFQQQQQQQQQKQQRQSLQEGFMKRPVIRSRSQTFGGSPQEFHTMKNTIFSNKNDIINAANKSHKHQQHLVEVLGIDGVRMDSLERAQMNFSPDNRSQKQQQERYQKENVEQQQKQQQEQDRQEQQDEKQQPQAAMQEPQQDAKSASSADANAVITTDTEAYGAGRTVTEEQDKNSSNSKGDLWLDLHQELNEPGPAVTEPGQSKEEVTKDATQPKDSDSSNGNTDANADDRTKKSKQDQKAEDAKQQTKLPGGRRIDHVLQPESFMSMIANEYLVGLRAHFSYWTNKDLLWHIVCRLENLEEVIASSNDSTKSTTHSSAGGSTTNDAAPNPTAGSSSSIINKEQHPRQ
ncbi:hypothetical protein BDB00DRAFT_216757 [Zychaea mexicana]|uniref:uncharacterized protein n=1 Tax=Zychaea mexicana TaxID=64656 RepID=UPI0022FEE744|nr:uncharacterized protein BDB00DRAFT_216757 [Zychaea mexicana]KAI9472906.1 hypothetical protein BDB00DRAFT_216757 [Zychaea mexicana]